MSLLHQLVVPIPGISTLVADLSLNIQHNISPHKTQYVHCGEWVSHIEEESKQHRFFKWNGSFCPEKYCLVWGWWCKPPLSCALQADSTRSSPRWTSFATVSRDLCAAPGAFERTLVATGETHPNWPLYLWPLTAETLQKVWWLGSDDCIEHQYPGILRKIGRVLNMPSIVGKAKHNYKGGALFYPRVGGCQHLGWVDRPRVDEMKSKWLEGVDVNYYI